MKITNKSFLRFILTILLIGGVGLFLYSYNNIDKPDLVNTKGRIFAKAEVLQIIQDNVQENGNRIGDQVVLLQLDNGEVLQANSPNGLLFGTVCHPGMKVIVISSRVGNLYVHTVYNVDRAMPIYFFLSIFLLLLCLVGGRKGIQSAIALIFSFICFIFLFFPMILRGTGPIWAAVITSTLVLTATICLINGFTIKALSAILATVGGILISAFSALAFGHFTALSGYNVSNIEALMFVGQNTPIDVGQILFAGVLFACLGAIMDIAMDVSSAVHELHINNSQLGAQELFRSGMNVGRDVMGTMAATLILAFFGGALGIWVMDYVYNLPYLQLINSNAIGIEIMQSIAGSFGIILTVPLAAALSSWLPFYLSKEK
jgi:uncharacterized membrane protein